jgi:tetratricopeptide (TPR) repeat protein
MVAYTHSIAGQYDAAASAALRTAEYASSAGDARLVGRGASGYASMGLRGRAATSDLIAQCEKLLREITGDRKAEAIISGSLAQLHAMRSDFAKGRDSYRHFQDVLTDLGAGVNARSTSIESSRVEVLAGDLDAAERELRRDDASLAAIGERYFRSTVAGLLADVLFAKGQLAEADSYSSLCQEIADEDDALSQVLWRSVRAKLEARGGRFDRARALMQEAVDRAGTTDDIDLQADTQISLADVAGLSGAEDDSRNAVERALRLYERKENLTMAERVRSRLAAVNGSSA